MLLGAALPAILMLAYAFWPGDPLGLIPGAPWQALGGAVTTIVAAGLVLKSVFPSTSRFIAWTSMLLVVLLVARMLLAATLIPAGWSSTFFLAADAALRPVERIGQRAADGGRIERRIAVSERSPAFQFLNDDVLSPGGPHPVDHLALELRWHAYLLLDRDARVAVRVASTGTTRVAVDGRTVDSSVPSPQLLAAGVHDVAVTYRKPAGERPQILVAVEDPLGAELPLFANPPTPGRLRLQSFARAGLLVLDVLAISVTLAWLWPALAAMVSVVRRRGSAGSWHLLHSKPLLLGIPLVAFALHGLVAAASQADLTVFLIGDDMRRYAADGRAIVTQGLLMNQGRPLFSGEPFFFYPLYPYFVGLTHILFDESFYGLVLLQFILLGATISAVSWVADAMFGRSVAWLCLLILCALAEMDFTRYYTVSVFTDNLYYPLVAGAVAAMWRMQTTGLRRDAIVAGMAGGLATLTRPSMMFVLPLFVLWLLGDRSQRTVVHRRSAVVAFGASWIAIVGLATLRNWLVSGRFVLLAESSLQVLFFLAPPGVNFAAYMPNAKPSVIETVAAALKMFRDHPVDVILVEARKLAFMVGFTNVMPSFRIHPEFLALSGAYLGWWLQVGRRGASGAAVHLTLLGHVTAFLVASPMSYGYKNMLTLMLLIVPFAAAFLWSFTARVPRANVAWATRLPADQIR